MTVTYTHEVRDCKGLGCFWKLLFRWRGSIYKLVWPDLISYTSCYFILSLIYRLGLDEEGKRIFEMVALYCQNFSNLIPLSFVLGFYVNIVFQRWWDQYLLLPWPDSLSLFSSAAIQGQDDRSRMMRRTIVRYANLAFILTLRKICVKVKKRFPTYEHLVEAGLLEVNEKEIFDKVESKTSHLFYWMPLVWAGAIVSRARKENKIKDDFAVKTIIDEINRLRSNLGRLLSYDTISIPLVYTQVVTLAVYTFFLSTLMGRQFLDPKKKYDQHTVDYYVPIFSYLQFFFYMGWLKVAESLINPFGEDDDDFEINWLIDRNVQISYMIVDEIHNDHPTMIQDMYWDEVFPAELPYTVASEAYRKEPPMCSTDYFDVGKEDGELIPKTNEDSSVIEHNDCESQLSGPKRTEMFHKKSVMLTNAIRIWKNFAPSVAGGTQTESSATENNKAAGSVDMPDNGLMCSSQSSERSDDSDRVHSRETLICTRNKSGSPACCKKSNIGEQSTSLQSSKAQSTNRELEGKVNTVFFIHPTPQNSWRENSSDRPKPVINAIQTDTSITSYTPDETDSQSQLHSRYFPVYDKPTKYLQENVSKGMQIQNRNSKDRFPNNQKDPDNDGEASRQSLDKEPKNENAIEFWF